MPILRLSVEEWSRHRFADQCRKEALERLYARRDAVDDLIRSLENYERCQPLRKGECLPFSAAERYS